MDYRQPLGASLDIIPQGSDWKYLDNGSDQGTAWRELGFDDGQWARGAAELASVTTKSRNEGPVASRTVLITSAGP